MPQYKWEGLEAMKRRLPLPPKAQLHSLTRMLGAVLLAYEPIAAS